MIGVIGHMSGGKSYYAVERMLTLLSAGHVVVSNIRLNPEAVTSYLNIPFDSWREYYYELVDDGLELGYHQLHVSDYESYPAGVPRGEPGYEQNMVYVFLDEASSIFDSMAHASDSSVQKVATWARHTRKMGIELVLLMQFASELHKRLRNHILEYVSCVNTSEIRVPLLGCHLPRPFRGFSIRTLYLPDLETRIGDSKWVKFQPAVYRCYTTSQIVVGNLNNARPKLPALQVDRRDYALSLARFLMLLFTSFIVFGGFLCLYLLRMF